VNNRRALLLSPLWLIVALITFIVGGTASAAASSGPETRVRAFDTPTENSVAAISSETAGDVGCLRPSQPQLAVGSCVATNTVVGGLDDLAARRAALGASPAGPGVSPTLSRLDVDGMAPIYGTSGHGQTVTLRVNPISRTHAETDVLQQLSNLGGANGAKATIYIDYPGGLCGACGRSGAVRSMAGQVGISELTVVWPGGSTVIVP
jgi:hypothetical protein